MKKYRKCPALLAVYVVCTCISMGNVHWAICTYYSHIYTINLQYVKIMLDLRCIYVLVYASKSLRCRRDEMKVDCIIVQLMV